MSRLLWLIPVLVVVLAFIRIKMSHEGSPMRWLRFLSRLALICSLFLLVAMLLSYFGFVTNEPLVSTVVIIGYFLGLFFVIPFTNICYLISLLLRKPLFSWVPRWLVITNVLFFIGQIVYIFFLNDTFHY